MNLFSKLQKIIINKKNLDLQSKKYYKSFDKNIYINLFEIKDAVIGKDFYQNLLPEMEINLSLYKNIHYHIFNSLHSIFIQINNLLLIYCSQAQSKNPFSYTLNFDLSNFHKGYIKLNYFPNIALLPEQSFELNKILIKEILLISSLSNEINEQYKINKNTNSFHLTIDDAINIAYKNISLFLENKFVENKNNERYHNYQKMKRKSYY